MDKCDTHELRYFVEITTLLKSLNYSSEKYSIAVIHHNFL